MSDDWYRRNVVDAIEGMAALTLEERGAYNTILDYLYLWDRPLVDDDRYLSGLLGCHVLKWKAIRKRLIELGKLFIVDGTHLDNRRANQERTDRASTKVQRRLAGGRGGIASGLSRGRSKIDGVTNNENNDLGEAPASRVSNQIRREEIREESPLPPKGGEKVPKANGHLGPRLAGLPDPIDEAFQRFKAEYPKRDGPQDWKKAEQRFRREVSRGADPEAIARGARAYRQQLEAKGKAGTEFVKQAAVFLNAETWREYADSGPNGLAIETDEVWEQRLLAARTKRKWASAQWGPQPGQNGCRVPPGLVRAGDGVGWTEWTQRPG